VVCLDSDIIIDFLRKEKSAVFEIGKMNEGGVELSTTSISAFELLKGNTSLSQRSDKEALEGLLKTIKIYDFNLKSSRKAAEIFNNLKEEGNLIELPDIMIASIAMSNSESLLTNNKKHFQRIEGLRLL